MLKVHTLAPVSSRFGNDSYYASVMNYYSPAHTSNARSTNAHETAHFICAQLRQRHRGLSAFYIGKGAYVTLTEPNFKLEVVRNYLPQSLRGYRYQLYLVQQTRYWNDKPLYILEELVCYIHGGRVCVDDIIHKRYNEGGSDGVSGCFEFSLYLTALYRCILDRDPLYLEREPQFAPLFEIITTEASGTFMAGKDFREMRSPSQDKLLAAYMTAEGNTFRSILGNKFTNTTPWL